MKLDKKISLKTFLVAVICLTILLPTLTYVIVSASPSTITVRKESFIKTASFVIDKSGSTYRAWNGTDGSLFSSGTNASQIIQNAIDVITSLGQVIAIKRGIYSLDTTLNLKVYASLIGEGRGTRLQYDGSDYAITIEETGVHHFIKDLWIELQTNPLGGIKLQKNFDTSIINVGIKGTVADNTQIGILLNGTVSCYWNSIIDSWIETVGTGIYVMGDANANFIFGTTFRWIYSIGLDIEELADSGTVTNNWFEAIEGGLMTAIRVAGRSWTFDGNRIEEATAGAVGINFTSTSVANNVFGGYITIPNPIVDNGVRNRVHHISINEHLTDYSGSAEASNDDWIAFGTTFLGTPQIVILTVQESDARYIAQVKAKNTTHFQLYLYDETAGVAETVDKTISWYAEYQP